MIPTCVMTVAAGAVLLLSLTALIFGLSLTFRQQRGNGLPQKLGLALGDRAALFLDAC